MTTYLKGHLKLAFLAIKLNISLIELDRFLESESKSYQKTKNKNTFFMKANPDGIDGFLPHEKRREIIDRRLELNPHLVGMMLGFPLQALHRTLWQCLIQ